MKITVRLYRQTDLDLIGLACADGVSVSKELKKVLVSFVRGTPYSISLNPIDVSDKIILKKQIQLQFYLEKKEQDVIDWLKTIRVRQRNSFLKNLFRSSLPCPYLYMYQTDADKVNQMITDIKKNGGGEDNHTVPKATVLKKINAELSVNSAVPSIPSVQPSVPTISDKNEPTVVETASVVSETQNPPATESSTSFESGVQEEPNTTSVNDAEEDDLFYALLNM